MVGQAVFALCMLWAGSVDASEDTEPLELSRRGLGGSLPRCPTTGTKSPAS